VGAFSKNVRIAFKFNSSLFIIPHKPPAGSFRVLHASARGEGYGARQKPKTNLETDEFASNPPFSKKSSRRFHFAIHFPRERLAFKKKIENLELKKKVLNSGTLARKLFQII